MSKEEHRETAAVARIHARGRLELGREGGVRATPLDHPGEDGAQG